MSQKQDALSASTMTDLAILLPEDTFTVVTVSVLFGACLAFFTLTSLYPKSLLRWLQRKRYQYEVTFSLYMMTATEKFIFNSIIFLFISMTVIAACLYLPDHLSIIVSRAFYYYSGDAAGDANSSEASSSALLADCSVGVQPAAIDPAGQMT